MKQLSLSAQRTNFGSLGCIAHDLSVIMETFEPFTVISIFHKLWSNQLDKAATSGLAVNYNIVNWDLIKKQMVFSL